MTKKEYVGFTCAYTPLAVIDAAGFTPFRILPTGDWPDQAGRLLHDNLCPHIKRVLDRAIDGDLPELSGMIFINSCDAMRRLSDAWKKIRPHDKMILLDLPATPDEVNISYYAGEIKRLWQSLNAWQGKEPAPEITYESIGKYNDLSERLKETSTHIRKGHLPGGSSRMQEIYNLASTSPAEETMEYLKSITKEISESDHIALNKVPVFVFGNMLPDPSVFSLFENSGAYVAGDDFCTGSRLFKTAAIDKKEDVFLSVARQILLNPPCARTFKSDAPGEIAEDILSKAKACNAKGVIGHTIKFCDPYLARLPLVRNALKKAGIPLLILEGDCTTRSIEQQKTRIEAFIEMLG